MCWPGIFKCAVDCCDDDVADTHAYCTCDKECFAAEIVDEEDGGESEDDLKNAGYTCGEEVRGYGGEAKGLEDLGSVVENGVDTCEYN